MKKSFLFLLLSFIILSVACSDTLEDSIYDKKSDPHVDEPTIGNAVPSQESIIVRGIQSKHCEEYCVYYRRVFPGVSQDEILVQDVSLWTIAARVNRDNTEDIIIEDLEPGEMYVIAVIGIDSFGNKSEPVFFEEKGRGNIAFLIPLAYAGPPAQVKNVYLNLHADGHSIIVSNINCPDMYQYEIQWREALPADSSWQSSGIVSSQGPGDPLEYVISSTEHWERYQVRVRAYNANGPQYGEFSQVQIIETNIKDYDFSLSVAWVNLDSTQMYQLADIKLNISNLPVNTDTYEVLQYGWNRGLENLNDIDTGIVHFWDDNITYRGDQEFIFKIFEAGELAIRYSNGARNGINYLYSCYMVKLVLKNKYGQSYETNIQEATDIYQIPR